MQTITQQFTKAVGEMEIGGSLNRIIKSVEINYHSGIVDVVYIENARFDTKEFGLESLLLMEKEGTTVGDRFFNTGFYKISDSQEEILILNINMLD